MLEGSWFVNENNRSIVLKRGRDDFPGTKGLTGHRQDVIIRVKNFSHQIAITPRIGLGSVPDIASGEVRGDQIQPLCTIEVTIPKEDLDGVQFRELYIFLDYVETLPQAQSSRGLFPDRPLESPAGVEFTVAQLRDHQLFYFYDDGVTGAFSS